MEASILSEGIVAGAIQIPGDGQPIILRGETVTGGYRKISTVISVVLPLAGQLSPGNTVQFVQVDMELARTLLEEQERFMAQLESQVRAKTGTTRIRFQTQTCRPAFL